jgi:hypothetical protein
MTFDFYFNQEKLFLDQELTRSLNDRYEKIYRDGIYKTSHDHIREIKEKSILNEPLFKLVMNKIHLKFQAIINVSDLKFNKLWLVSSSSNNTDKNTLPYIPHIDKQRYLKAMVYLHDVSHNHGPIHLGKIKANIDIEKKRKNLPKNYKVKGLNTIEENLLDTEMSPIIGKSGDVIFFDTNTPHKAGIVKEGFCRKVLRFDFERPFFNHKTSVLKSLIGKIFKI